MEPFIYEIMWKREASHWWFRARCEILTALVRSQTPAGSRILDAGCGTGFIAENLLADHRVALVDSSPEAVRFCARRGVPAAQASLKQLPYANDTFDLVECFDVLYHRAMHPLKTPLGEIHRVLKPGGMLIVTEPAYQWLYGEADVLDHAEKRFTASELGSQLSDAGFAVRELGYFNTYLAPAIVLVRLLRRFWVWAWPWAHASTEFDESGGVLSAALEKIFRAEKDRVLRGGYPFGISVLGVAEKVEKVGA